MVLVFGDTNSTLAGALAAVKLCIPVCHVEAGCRLKTLTNPEEVNRIVTDHVSSLHLACTPSGVENLEKEGFGPSVFLVGDPMYDAFCYYSSILDGSELAEIVDFDGKPVILPKSFYYMTCHRQENTDTDEKLKQILQAMEQMDAPVIYPVHPRNHARAERLKEQFCYQNTILTAPVSYKTSISLINHAKKIATDSGGLQREAFFAEKQCITILDGPCPCWVETLPGGCNRQALPQCEDILQKLSAPCHFDPAYRPFGDGHSAEKIVKRIKEFLQ